MATTGPAPADLAPAILAPHLMARSLHPFTGPPSRRRRWPGRRERDLWAPPRRTRLDLTPGGLRLDRGRRGRTFRPRRQLDLGVLLIAVAASGLALWLAVSFWDTTRVHVEMAGFEDGGAYTPAAASGIEVAIAVPESGDRFRAEVTVDGIDVLEHAEFEGDTLRLRLADLVTDEVVESALDEGEHAVRVSVGRLFLADSVFQWRYAVDSVAPVLEVVATLDPVPIDEPVEVAGTVEEDAALLLDGEPIDTDGGRFKVEFEHPPTGALHFEAVDRAGNRTAAETVVPVVYPAASRGVHVSAAAWASEPHRAHVLDLLERGLIDTVELDLKDESGIIGWDSELEIAERIGAIRAEFDLAEAVSLLEERGARVIGRLVAFRDPVYARAAWTAGRTDEVVQTPDGAMLGTYGGFTNYAHPAVQDYNLSIALEAVELGVDDILWDYIRRPEGSPETMLVPGLDGRLSSEVVAAFLERTHDALRNRGVHQGASVFGIAAARGDAIAQDIPRMARAVDYLAPMIYPSHWGAGQYDVDSPIHEPFEITKRSLTDFQAATAGSGVRMLPWIQDFSLGGVPYGPAEVRAQIDAAASIGLTGFLLWNANVTYTADALVPIG